MNNPFIFDRPVESEKFIGRKRELRRLLATITHAGSLVVTGQPRIGKTSLLGKVLDEIKALRANNESFPAPIFMTSGYLDADASPSDFWQYVVNSAVRIAQAGPEQVNIDEFHQLEKYIQSLDIAGQKFVLIMDGIGWLLDNQKFGIPFWARLRGLATRTRLSIIVFSRLNALEIQTQIEKGQRMGSPMMNFATEIVLAPFSRSETMQLVQSYASEENKSLFTPRDKRIIWQLSGGYPFLVQLAASVIWESRVNGQPIAEDGYGYIKNVMLEVAHPHFWDVWRYLSLTAQAIGLMVALREIATYHKYNTLGLDEALKTCEMDILALKRTGLLSLDNHTPVLSSLSFGMWILRTQVGSGTKIPQPDEWLRQNQKVFGPATRRQIDVVAQAVGRLYAELRESIIDLGEELARSRLGL